MKNRGATPVMLNNGQPKGSTEGKVVIFNSAKGLQPVESVRAGSYFLQAVNEMPINVLHCPDCDSIPV